MKIKFYPLVPKKNVYKINYILDYLNYQIVEDFNEADFIFYFEGYPYRNNFKKQEYLKQYKNVININLKDTRKNIVDDYFKKHFGYSSLADESNIGCYVVEKDIFQATHSGKIIEYTGQQKENTIYQKLIDTRISNNEFYDLRLTVSGDDFSVIIRIKNTEKINYFMSSNHSEIVKIKDKKEIFTNDEIKKIINFSKDFGIDFGDLDILRDNLTSKIYIVDVNNTSDGCLLRYSNMKDLPEMAEKFKTMLENWI